MTDVPFGLSSIGQILVPVRDAERPAELWMCFTTDPDGNNIGLMSEVPIIPAASGS